jgi:hypothetical protein
MSARLASIGAPLSDDARKDKLTALPLDVLHSLVTCLPTPSYLALTSACRFLRYQALTIFQPHARRRVLELQWAIPLTDEYTAMKRSPSTYVVHAENSPHDADWLLYLSHVHRTKSMRARKWIWSLCKELKATYEVKKVGSVYADIGKGEKAAARVKLEEKVRESIAMMDHILDKNGKAPVHRRGWVG